MASVARVCGDAIVELQVFHSTEGRSMKPTLSTSTMSSPLGEILLVATPQGDALCGLYLESQKYFPGEAAQWRAAPRLPVFRDAIAQLREYFAGARTRFDLP